ncbi:MAG TPA: DUF3566 domain-containing protein [Mycobacteriales bacterium]|nr:DUF3566 domain-containing protein [Mycobacteriales bacterium]
MTTGSGESSGYAGGSLVGDPAYGSPASDRDSQLAGSLATGPSRPMSVGTAAIARRRGRRARLTLKRIDPWSTLKFSLVYGLVGMAVLLVAVVVLYGVVDAMGVISSLRTFLSDVSDTSHGPGLAAWLGFGRVLLIALVVGLVNVVLFAAFATLTAFIYNVCTDIVGGVEVTLSERE